jgi:hypothetical protein
MPGALVSTFLFWQMLNDAPLALVKEPKVVKLFWNLCNKLFESVSYVFSNIKFTTFEILNHFTGCNI